MSTTERTRTRAIALGLLVLVFGAGALASASVPDRTGELPPAEALARAQPDLDEIGLTNEQRNAIDSVLAIRQPQLDSILGAVLEDVQEVLAEVDADVRAHLSPAQVEAYEQLRKGGSRVQFVRRTQTQGGELRVDTIR